MKTKLLALVLLASGTIFAGITLGIHIGRRQRHGSSSNRPARANIGHICRFEAIGTRSKVTTSGMTVITAVRHMKAPVWVSHRAMTENNIIRVIGRVLATNESSTIMTRTKDTTATYRH